MIWLSNPASQSNPHHWAGTYAGHMVIGLYLWLIGLNLPLGLDIWDAVLAAWALYALWELIQWRRYGGDPADCVLDWDAAAIGAVIGAGLWARDLPLAGGVGIAALVVVAAGIYKRREG